jgi:phytoene synthase
MAPASREGLARLTARLASLAARHEESARAGAAALPFRSAWAVLAAAHIYGGIARKVERAGEAALDRRISTSRAEKAWGIALGGAQALVRRSGDAAAPRDPALWQRPILG